MGRAIEKPLKADTGAGDLAAVLAMEAHRAWRRVQLREALDSPYFARIDFVPEGGQLWLESFYPTWKKMQELVTAPSAS